MEVNFSYSMQNECSSNIMHVSYFDSGCQSILFNGKWCGVESNCHIIVSIDHLKKGSKC